MLIAAEASAQISGTFSLLSDYRYRGVSLSRDDPAVQASLAYDDPSGVYLGLFASSVRFGLSSHRELELVPYLGYAWRIAPGLSAEIGAEHAAFSGPGSYDYSEFYVGATLDNLTARLYYAPRYFGRDSAAIYAELNGVHPLSDRVRALAHVGIVFNRGDEFTYGQTDRSVVDGRLGIAIDIASLTLQASWVGIGSGRTGYPIPSSNKRNTAVVTLSASF